MQNSFLCCCARARDFNESKIVPDSHVSSTYVHRYVSKPEDNVPYRKCGCRPASGHPTIAEAMSSRLTSKHDYFSRFSCKPMFRETIVSYNMHKSRLLAPRALRTPAGLHHHHGPDQASQSGRRPSHLPHHTLPTVRPGHGGRWVRLRTFCH